MTVVPCERAYCCVGARKNAGLTGFTRSREERDLKSRLPNTKCGALHCLISLRPGPFWSPGRNRGRTNDGSACRPLFYAFTATRASRTVRLSDQIRHGYDLVLDWNLTRGVWNRGSWAGTSTGKSNGCRRITTLNIFPPFVTPE